MVAGVQTAKIEVTISSAEELPEEFVGEAENLQETASIWQNRKLQITVGVIALAALITGLLLALSSSSSGSGSVGSTPDSSH